MTEYRSPNGHQIIGTAERLECMAHISGINDDGTPDYAGSTDVNWDSQTSKTPGQVIFVDENYDEWTFDQLKPWKEEDEEA